jgi:hypothetical protein
MVLCGVSGTGRRAHRHPHRSIAYSALACCRMGGSGWAAFQGGRKPLLAARALALLRCKTQARVWPRCARAPIGSFSATPRCPRIFWSSPADSGAFALSALLMSSNPGNTAGAILRFLFPCFEQLLKFRVVVEAGKVGIPRRPVHHEVVAALDRLLEYRERFCFSPEHAIHTRGVVENV